ncbi:MAG: type II CAAX endopeptidase family protein [Tissierellaceae bacterium]
MSREEAFSEEDYKGLLEGLNRKDALYGIGYYMSYMLMVYLFGLLVYNTSIYESLAKNFNSRAFFRLAFNIPYAMINIMPIFIILRFRKQDIATVGIKKDKGLKSIAVGIVGSIPFSLLNIIWPISNGKVINPNMADNLWTFLYYLLCISFTEELVFRGYLQSRMGGIVKSKWLKTIVVGIMFAIMHIPFQMIKANMTPMEFIGQDLGHLINTSVIHIYLVFLFGRDNNIVAPTLAHAIINFSYDIFI